jgi:hypothetical protein
MGFISWIAKKRKEVPPATPARGPENAKQMYAREAANEKARPIEQIPDGDKASAKAIGERIDRMTQHLRDALSEPSGQAGFGGSPAAGRQNMIGQETPQEALSPTDGRAGSVGGQTKQPEQARPEVQKTLPRRPPSWER